jgi:hypothetical protein
MAKNRGQRRYYPSMAAHTPRPIVRPRIEIDRSLAWFAIHCRSRAEQQAQDDLQRAGFSTYLPTQSLQVVKRGKLVEIERVPVSGYLFVGLCARQPDFAGVDDALGWSPVEWYRPALGSLIRIDREPIRVGAGALQAFADECCFAGLRGVASGRSRFQHGEVARITEGACAGLSIRVQDVLCDGRVRGLVDMLGGRVVVETTVDQLEAA